MRLKLFRTFAVLAVLGLSATGAAAQSDRLAEFRTVHELTLSDGSRMYGSVEAETDTTLSFRTTAGALVEAPKANVVSIKKVAGRMVRGEFRREDPNNT